MSWAGGGEWVAGEREGRVVGTLAEFGGLCGSGCAWLGRLSVMDGMALEEWWLWESSWLLGCGAIRFSWNADCKVHSLVAAFVAALVTVASIVYCSVLLITCAVLGTTTPPKIRDTYLKLAEIISVAVKRYRGDPSLKTLITMQERLFPVSCERSWLALDES